MGRTLCNSEIIRHLNVLTHKESSQYLSLIHQWVTDCGSDTEKLKTVLDNECKPKYYSKLRDCDRYYMSLYRNSPLKNVEVPSLNSHKYK